MFRNLAMSDTQSLYNSYTRLAQFPEKKKKAYKVANGWIYQCQKEKDLQIRLMLKFPNMSKICITYRLKQENGKKISKPFLDARTPKTLISCICTQVNLIHYFCSIFMFI